MGKKTQKFQCVKCGKIYDYNVFECQDPLCKGIVISIIQEKKINPSFFS